MVFDLNTKANTYNLSGDFKYSHVKENGIKDGINSQLNFGETSGKYRFSAGADVMTRNYDPNDLGINFETNFYSVYGNTSYRILNPTKIFNTFSASINSYNQFNLDTNRPQTSVINLNINTTTKKNHFVGFYANANPVKTYDYYEPRVAGRFMLFPQRIGANIYVSTNYNNKFAIDLNPAIGFVDEPGRNFLGMMIGPRYRFSDKLLVVLNFDYSRRANNRGWVDNFDTDQNPNTPNDIVFATRLLATYSSSISSKYAINSDMNFNLSVRQYWSYAENNQYLALQNDGTFQDLNNYVRNRNSSFNTWNMDLSYNYWFAPGSVISVLYRNSSASFDREINKSFSENVNNILTNDRLNHALSVSVRYFIDYNQAKNWVKI